MNKCISCNVNITNLAGSVKFKCPNCSKSEIIRCNKCRINSVKYRCKNCDYEGPN